MPRYLVVGSDSLVGAGLLSLMQKAGADVTGTTRRSDLIGDENLLLLDLAHPVTISWRCSDYSVAFLCAAITSIVACEDDPAGTQRINVLNTVALAKRLLDAGTRIVYLSSNTVFDGTTYSDENSPYSPVCEYGRQKVSVERQLLALSTPSAPVTIVRLSKVLTANSGVVADFIRHLLAGEPCPAFTDLRMCPVSLNYTTGSLLTIARAGISGIFHLSGEIELSYADFASRLAIRLGTDSSLVQAGLSTASGARVVFQPVHPGLGLQRTHKRLGIGPEPLNDLMDTLLQEHSQRLIHQ